MKKSLDSDRFVHQNQFRYHGRSMLPTFKPGQVLYVRPASRQIEPGDIVVFKSDTVDYIVHRVNSISNEGIHTRGDNNPFEDEQPVRFDQIIGIVEKKDDWGVVQSVIGGRKGLLIARIRWFIYSTLQKSLPIIGFPFRILKPRRWIGKVWHPKITKLELRVQENILIKYIIHGKTVAIWQPDQNRFFCKRPYDLIISRPGVLK